MSDAKHQRVREYLINLSRREKRLVQVCADVLLIWFALWLSFIVRLGIDEMYNPIVEHGWLFLAAPVVAIPLFILAAQLMNGAGLTQRIVRLCAAIVGDIKGGLAVVAVLACLIASGFG